MQPDLPKQIVKISEPGTAPWAGSPDWAGPCLGVVMPIYNEEPTVEKILERVLAQSLVKQVIAVDDGSGDGTWACLQRVAAQAGERLQIVQHPQNRGKGAAIRTALEYIRTPVVVIQDGDMEYDPADYELLLEKMRQGAQVVYGSRFLKPSSEGGYSSTFWHRSGNRLLTSLTNAVSGQHLSDSATCYKMFRWEVLGQIDLQEERFGFCPEVTMKVSRLGIRIIEVPIRYQFRTQAEGKKIRLTDGFKAVYCLLRYAWFPERNRF